MTARPLGIALTLLLASAAASSCGKKDDTSGSTGDTDGDTPGTTDENLPPNALDDEWTTWSGATALIDVLLNDDDPEGKPLTLESVTDPDDGGTTEIVSEEEISYTPAPGFVGTAAFSYEVADKRGQTDKGIVRVTVLDPPTVTITSPAEGSEHPEDATVEVTFEVVGCEIADPDIDYTGCHLHKYVDGRAWDGNSGREHFGLGAVEFRRLDPGEHDIELRFAVNDGSDGEFDPKVADEVSITVVPLTVTDTSVPSSDSASPSDSGSTTDTHGPPCVDTAACPSDTGLDTGVTTPCGC